MPLSQEPETQLDEIVAQLERWNVEADALRAVAQGARQNDASSSMAVDAADETHARLMQLVEQLDRALTATPAGHQAFSDLLHVQGIALNLLESIGNSLDALQLVTVLRVSDPRTIPHQASGLVAAE